MRNNYNKALISGYLYDVQLAKKTVKDTASANFGKEFIQGNISIATDEDFMNVVQVFYTYVTAKTKNGKENKTFSFLSKFVADDEAKKILPIGLNVGKEAIKVSVDTAIALNDFYSTQNKEFVSAPRCEGGFIKEINSLPDEDRNSFETDMIINQFIYHEKDEEKEIDAYAELKGVIFNFRNDILPICFTIKKPAGIKYFEDLDISPSNPIYTKVWGLINNTTVKIKKIEECAFDDEPKVTYSEFKRKEWLVVKAKKEPYLFDDENTITAAELHKATQDREVYLAEVKKRAEEYQANKKDADNAFNTVPTASAIPTGNFTF